MNQLIEGVTGVIDFGGDITRHVPQNKPVTILQVNNGKVNPSAVATCGTTTTDPSNQPTW